MPKSFIKYFAETLFWIFLISIISCTQPIILKNIPPNEPGYFMFGRIPQRNFYENISIDIKTIEEWNNQTTGAQSNSSIVIYGNIIFVNDLSGRLYAFDRLTGKTIGHEKFKGSIDVTPVINQLRIMFVVNERLENYSSFVVYDFSTGKILKEDKIESGVKNEMIRVRDGIIVFTDNGELIKYDLVGNRIWSIKTKSASFSSPASNQDLIITGNQKGEILFVSSTQGQILFNYKIAHAVSSGITIDNENCYFADDVGNLYSYNYSKHKLNWFAQTNYKITATPVYDENNIYVGNLSGEVFSFNKESGAINWKIKTGGLINTTPLLTKTILIQPDVNKKIFLINSENGKIENTLDFDRRLKLSPVIYDSLLYLGSDRGVIHAYQINK